MAALVTIGIVTWNSASDVERCLDAVRAQQHQPIELLVGDNASTDGTRAVLEARTGESERRYFPANRGFSAAHNALIRDSRGVYYLSLNGLSLQTDGTNYSRVNRITRWARW